MTDWTMMHWHGTPEAAMAGLRLLGWSGPGETSAHPVDARIGGFVPSSGSAPSVFDGIAFVGVVASAAIETPPGLAETGPELSRALLGSF